MNTTFCFDAPDEQATASLGRALAAGMQAGDVLALNGPLGAGKTRLVRAIAERLGCVDQLVNSPTFVLIHEYDGAVPVYHVDAYRLRDADEFLEIGGDEVLNGDRACLIEWGDRIASVLPPDHLRIDIEVVAETGRRFVLTAAGARSKRLIEQLLPHRQVGVPPSGGRAG